MKLISARSGLYTLKALLFENITLELTNQLALLEAISEKSDYEELYYNILKEYFVVNDEGETVLNIFLDRSVAFDDAEIPALNIIVEGDENSENGSSENVQCEANFEIQCLEKSFEDDSTSNDRAEFMSGIIRLILENLSIAGIQHKRVTRRRFYYKNTTDASNIVYSGVIFFVKYIEKILVSKNPVTLQTNITKFREKYQLKTDNLGG